MASQLRLIIFAALGAASPGLVGCGPEGPKASQPGDGDGDGDGDGWHARYDCDDLDAGVHPGATERCDGLDNDCDGAVDEDGRQSWYLDDDGDGYGRDDAVIDSCEPVPNASLVPGDCDDADPATHTGAEEVCDGVDRDCDGLVDALLWRQDLDADGFAGAPSPWSVCDGPPPVVASAGDCDDADPLIFPGAGEVCGDGVDSDCDGKVSCVAVSISTEVTACDYVWALDNIWAVVAPCEGCSFSFGPGSVVLQPASHIVDCDPEFLPGLRFEFRGDQLYYTTYDYTAVHFPSTTGGWAGGVFGFDHTFDDASSPDTVNERWFGEFNLVEIQYEHYDYSVGGRPFTVDGAARLARTGAQGDAWSDAAAAAAGPPPVHLQRHIADRWAQLGRMEHASVGSFARFSLELLALGAPPALLTEAAASMADEVRHARSCFGLAEALGGGPVRPGALDLSGSLAHLDRSVDVHAIFTALLTEACVVETVAAAQAERARAAAVDPAVRAVLSTIVADEARHAAYGWRCARWMLGAHPELRGLVRPLLARLAPADQPLPPADPHADILAHFGLLDRRAQAQAARDAHQKVIQPAAALLLREGPDFA
ncbi:MAG: hypothetical protein JNM72_26295 [Deltaproteobacteria bacterium]|nr:hypothetical protein [Deltaproteobacteria bacterium]